MAAVFKGLELDLFDFHGKFVSIIEDHYADANLCVNGFLWQALKVPDTGLCLFSLYHSIQHYYHVGMRLGINLSSAFGKRFLAVDTLYSLVHASSDEEKVIFEQLEKNSLLKLFCHLKNNCDTLKKSYKYIYLIIDDLSMLLNLGVSAREIIFFLQHLRNLLDQNMTIVVGSHCSENDADQLLLKHFMCYNSHLRLRVSPLKTGFSKEVGGSIEVTSNDEAQIRGWTQPKLYHYKCGERTVKVFLPGNIDIV